MLFLYHRLKTLKGEHMSDNRAGLWFLAGMIGAFFVLPACTQKGETPPPEDEKAPPPAVEAVRSPTAEEEATWWPTSVSLDPLRDNDVSSNPRGPTFDYRRAFSKVEYASLKNDIKAVLTDSKDWWPADYGNYGPFFVRMAWHSAGTYRVSDGRGGSDGGQQRFAPLNSWPDNGNLDKARRLLWPVKRKYGDSVSWADLMILAANVGMEEMGFATLGFSGGRVDDWKAETVYWGPEKEMLGSSPDRFHAEKPRTVALGLGASHMGLIYVNPEGPDGKPDPRAAAHDIRSTFANMAMNDEETVALIAGGHTFGKAHGARSSDCVGVEPLKSGIATQGFGWHNKCGKGHSEDTVTSGLEGAWTSAPARWTHQYLSNLYGHEWSLTKSPAGAHQWEPEGDVNTVPDAHIEGRLHEPMMLTTDLSMRMDPAYEKISKRFLEDSKEFEDAFARAWFKLTHRDLGPKSRYVGPEVPEEDFLWQDPIPPLNYSLPSERELVRLKKSIKNSGLTTAELIRTAWASAATFRGTDMRGGANGARLRLLPQREWPVNTPAQQSSVLAKLEDVRKRFNDSLSGNKSVSLSDVIVLGGAVAIEGASEEAGSIKVSFIPGRNDASQEQTDVDSFAHLEPTHDGFRNFYDGSDERGRTPAELLIERAEFLTLTVSEMTALVGGLRVLGANADGSNAGVFTERPGVLSNDFFINLLDMNTEWREVEKYRFEGQDRSTGKVKWTATEVDLVFGSNSELRAVAEYYAYNPSEFRDDFLSAWTKVMRLDRFALRAGQEI